MQVYCRVPDKGHMTYLPVVWAGFLLGEDIDVEEALAEASLFIVVVVVKSDEQRRKVHPK